MEGRLLGDHRCDRLQREHRHHVDGEGLLKEGEFGRYDRPSQAQLQEVAGANDEQRCEQRHPGAAGHESRPGARLSAA